MNKKEYMKRVDKAFGPRYRTIDGKRYKLRDIYNHKKYAVDKAKRLRNKGEHIRVVAAPRGLGWALYCRI